MIDRDAFLKPRLPEADLDLPGVGMVRVRGLSRGEVLAMRELTQDEVAMEVRVLTLGLVDPTLTEEQVKEWHQSATQAEVAAVLDLIRTLSGLGEGAAKAAYKSPPG